MKAEKVCVHCDLGVDLPHLSDADCFRAIDREIKAAQAHLRTLTRRKSHLLRLRFQHRQRLVVASRRRFRRR
jgi:hypothetical protein